MRGGGETAGKGAIGAVNRDVGMNRDCFASLSSCCVVVVMAAAASRSCGLSASSDACSFDEPLRALRDESTRLTPT